METTEKMGGMGEGDNFGIRKALIGEALIGDAYIHHFMLCQRGQSLMKLHNSNYGAPKFRIMELPKCYRFMDFHSLVMVLNY